jgi:putative transposase
VEELAIAWIKKGYPVSTVLRICRIPRSTYYYRLKHPERRTSSNGGRPIPGYSFDKSGQKVSDARIKGYLRRLLNGPHAASGYRKLTKLLRRKYHLIINKKKVYRICKELGVLAPQRAIRNATPRRIARNRVVAGPNQLWQMDIKYGYVAGKREHFFVASVLDVFDRQIIAHHRGKSCRIQHVMKTLQKALLKRGVHAHEQELDKKLVIRTDNGPQFVSKLFHQFCEQHKIEHERIPNSTPNKNAFIEAFHSILEIECFQRNCFETYEEAFAEVDRFIHFYNNERLHGSLHDLPPKEYAELAAAKQVPIRKIAL